MALIPDVCGFTEVRLRGGVRAGALPVQEYRGPRAECERWAVANDSG